MDFYNIVVVVEQNCTKSKQQPEFLRRILSIISVYHCITLVLAPMNLLANGFSLHIFRQPIWKKSLMSCLLKGLSLFEIMFQGSAFVHSVLWMIVPKAYDYPSAVFVAYLPKVINCMMNAFQMARNWTVVLLAAYRYEVICRPLSVKKVFHPEYINPLLGFTLALSFVLAVPRIFESGVKICAEDWSNSKIDLLQSQPLYNYGYLGFVMFLAQSGGPVFSVCILSAFVLRVIWKRKQFRKEQNRRGAAEQRSPTGDKLVLTLSITFFIFETPAFFSKILNRHLTALNLIIQDISLAVTANILIYLDSFINVFVYMGSNPTFRKATASLLQSCGLPAKCWSILNESTTTTTTTTKNNNNNNHTCASPTNGEELRALRHNELIGEDKEAIDV